MRTLDDELRDALRREEPPDGFAERVLTEAAARPHAAGTSHVPVKAARRIVIGWAAAAALIAAVAGGVQYRAVQQAREERARGEAAKEQVVRALRIAGYKLHVVQEKIKEIGS
jgi:hypothetical protein